MLRINETTEQIIKALEKEPKPQTVSSFSVKVNLTSRLLINQMEVLKTYKVAEIVEKNNRSTIERMDNFIPVINAGGLLKYINQQKDKERSESNFILMQLEFLEKSIEKLSNELNDESVTIHKKLQKEQSDFFTTSSERNKKQIIYFIVALIVAILSLITSIIALNQTSN